MLRALAFFALTTLGCTTPAADPPIAPIEEEPTASFPVAFDSASASPAPVAVEEVPTSEADPLAANTDSTRTIGTPGDPSDDDAFAINYALRTASPGATVQLEAGRYHLRSEIAMRDGVTLRGRGDSTVLIDERGGDEKVVMFYEDHDAGLENLAIRSDAEAAMDDLVMVMNSDDVTLRGLTLRSFARNAVYVSGSERTRIERIDVAEATKLGGGEGYGVHLTKETSGSTVTDSDFGPPLRHGILIQEGSHGNRVENNRIRGTTRDGIDLHGSGEYDNVIVLNTVTDSGSAGIGVGETDEAAGRGNLIEGNTLERNKWGVILHGASPVTTVRGNTITASEDHGIYVKDAPETLVEGNRIVGTRGFWGIKILSGPGTRVTSNTLVSNRRPIDASEATDVEVGGNIIR